MSDRSPQRTTTWSVFARRYLGWAILFVAATLLALPWFLDGRLVLLALLLAVGAVAGGLALSISGRLARKEGVSAPEEER
jgi:hypothetical protein